MRFNLNLRRKQKRQIRNHEGAKAFVMSPEMELYTAVVTASLGGKFYESADARLRRIRKLIRKVKPEFVAKLAVYTRTEMHLRSVPLVLVTELARVHKGDDLVRRAVRGVTQRADEITELLAYYTQANERKGTKKLNSLSKQMQKGLADSFAKFDEYQFAKYNRKGLVTMRDALFLTHPRAASEEQAALYRKIAEDNLDTPYTWETELSALGKQGFTTETEKAIAFRDKWETLIDSGRLGYMALMRNLRNIVLAGVGEEYIELVAAKISDPHAVRRSKQLPFRFLSAYRELEKIHSGYVSYLLDALERAVLVSTENISGFNLSTRVIIASDVSGSMMQSISKKSTVQQYDIGLLLSMLLKSRSQNVITGIFGDSWKTVNLPSRGILANTMKLRKMEGKVGYATNGYKVLRSLTNKKQIMDKVIMFTDLQMWDTSSKNHDFSDAWLAYKTVAPDAKLYLFDLSGYGQSPVELKSNDVYLIAGWSDKVFDVLAAIEDGQDTLKVVKRISI